MMICEGCRIAIWGTGYYAKKFYLLEHKNFEVVCFYDNDKKRWGQELYGIPVKQWDNDKNVKIIIASSYWEEILKGLLEDGLRLLYDIIPFQFLHSRNISYRVIDNLRREGVDVLQLLQELKGSRKIAVIYGNCQTAMLGEILLINSSFADKYYFVIIPSVFEYNSGVEWRDLWDKLLEHAEFWRQVDLFLCQNVSVSNKFCPKLATDNIVKKLSSTCKIIRIVNIFFDGYFVQRINNNNNFMKEIQQSGLFPFGDIFVNELLKKGISIKDILKLIKDENFFTPEFIEYAVRQSLAELSEREKEVDVVISDYIESKCRETQLFYSPNHPVNTVLIEYARRIIRYMGLDDEEIHEDIVSLKVGCLKGQDIPIYPAVIKQLGLKEYDNRYYNNRYIEPDFLFDFDEYIRKYIFYCFPIKT